MENTKTSGLKYFEPHAIPVESNATASFEDSAKQIQVNNFYRFIKQNNINNVNLNDLSKDTLNEFLVKSEEMSNIVLNFLVNNGFDMFSFKKIDIDLSNISHYFTYGHLWISKLIKIVEKSSELNTSVETNKNYNVRTSLQIKRFNQTLVEVLYLMDSIAKKWNIVDCLNNVLLKTSENISKKDFLRYDEIKKIRSCNNIGIINTDSLKLTDNQIKKMNIFKFSSYKKQFFEQLRIIDINLLEEQKIKIKVLNEVDMMSYVKEEMIEVPKVREMPPFLKEQLLDMTKKGANSRYSYAESDEDDDFNIDYYSPKELKAILDKYIVNQDQAKKILSIAVSNHLLRLTDPDYDIPKQNIMLIGPSGSGKTEMLRVLKKFIDIPVHIIDANNISMTGFKGNSISEILGGLDRHNLEKSIIFIDEFDKLTGIGTASNGKDIGKSIQNNLLKIIEGETLQNKIDTSNMLFVLAGSFTDLRESKNKKSYAMGFDNVKETATQNKITEDDLIKEGVIVELLGRITFIEELNELTKDDYLNIIKNVDGNIYNKYISYIKDVYNIDVNIDDDYLYRMCLDIEKNCGARGLNKKISEIFENILYDIDDYEENKSITIDGENLIVE